jgi:predicted MFS family arabinose efflux permease
MAMDPRPFDVNSRSTVLAFVLIAAVVSASLLVAPALVGAMIGELGFTPAQAGYVIAAELGGMALATLPALFWMNRVDWRRAVRIAIVVATVATAASAFAHEFTALLLLRGLSGFAQGSAMVVCMATVGRTQARERNFGLWVVGQLVLGAVGLAVMPQVLPHTGLAGFYAVLAVLNAGLLACVGALPVGAASTSSSPVAGETDWTRGLVALAGLFSFYVALSGVWTYVERLATVNAIPAGTIGVVLAVATVCGVAGAPTASAIGARLAHLHAIVTGLVMAIAGVALLRGAFGLTQFALATGLFKFAWTFLLPYLLACIARFDPGGRLVVFSNLVIGSGLAVGPAVAAAMLGDASGGYAPVVTLGLAGLGVCALLYLPTARRTVAA